MDDAERAFRDALHRVDSVKIPVPSLEPADVRRTPGLGIMMGRWLAAAAVLAMVAGLAVWALAGRGQVVAGVPAQGATPASRVMLTGATWVALEFYGKPAARTNGAVPYLSFETDSTFFGGDDCEQSTAPTTIDTTEPLGSYRLVGNDLQVTLDPAKAIGCDPAERELIRTVLDSTRRVYRDGDTLELLDQPGSVLARFRATAGHQAATNGTGPSPTPTATNMPTRVPEVTPSIGPAPVIGVRIQKHLQRRLQRCLRRLSLRQEGALRARPGGWDIEVRVRPRGVQLHLPQSESWGPYLRVPARRLRG